MNVKTDRNVLLIAGVALLFVLSVALFKVSVSLKRDHEALAAKQKEMLILINEFLALNGAVSSVEAKKSLAGAEGVVQAVDEVFRSMGLTQKVKSVKSTGTREKKYSTDEEAEVSVEKVTMNEMVNILYRIENAPMILSIGRTSVKTAFDNPSLLNVTMTVSLIKPK